MDQRDKEMLDMMALFAMQGLIAAGNPQRSFRDSSSPAEIATRAYEFADAMMKVRKTRNAER